MRYIKVILPLKLAWEPCYRISEEVRRGDRVVVRFSGRRYTAVVRETDAVPEVDESRILPVETVERHLEPIGEKELELWRFMADYYLCSIGEVYKMAYPATKTAGETVKARAEERRELLEARTAELYLKRIKGLEERLAKKEEALVRRHNAKVTAELEAGRDKILAELQSLREKLEAIRGLSAEPGMIDSGMASRQGMTSGQVTMSGQETKAEPAYGNLSPAAKNVLKAFDDGRTVLLQGGASRIGVFVEIARKVLSEGHNVLMLVPEIALSKSLQATLREEFGDALLVFHSAETAGNRREVASLIRQGDRPRLVLGTRSALFLPFKDLGLVAVEEEHDIAYKQDGTPHYEARDCAVMLGSIHGAHVLLASPTPSLESIYNCNTRRYALVQLPLEKGEMEVVDTTAETRKRGMVGSISRILIGHIRETEASGKRTLILRPWGPIDDLEKEIADIFPEAKGISVSTVHEARRKDISGIALLAILNADVLLDKQDFRADEKAMQVLQQFRGRFSGKMLVQTRMGAHPVFGSDEGYAARLLEERKAFRLPPYTRMVEVVIRDGNAGRRAKLAGLLAEALEGFAPAGPFAPRRGRDPVPDTLVIRITLPKDRLLNERKKQIAGIADDFEKSYKYQGHITLDVDPI
jgi:primosomal protein N' (replication factor Y)